MPSGYDDRPTASPFPALIFSKLYRRYFPLLMGLAGRILHFDLIDSRGQRFFPTLREMPETLHSFNMTQWRQMGQDIVRILKLGQGIERNPQRLPDAYRKEDNFAVASAMLKGLLMSLDYYNILRPAEKEPSLRCNASTALQAAVFIE